MDRFPGLVHLFPVPVAGINEPGNPLLYDIVAGALQRESLVPSQQASRKGLGITSGGDAHHPFCSPDQADWGICNDLRAGREGDDLVRIPD